MAVQIGAYQAKTHLPALLERVARGEQFVITKHGRPIARLVPAAGNADIQRRRAAIARIKELRKGLTPGVPLKELIEEGRM